jgi:pyrroloquinoline quinone biosynthesis protein D
MTGRLEPGDMPRLAPHSMLKHDQVRGRWVVLAPETVLVPDEIALVILQKCDGETSIEQMARTLANEYQADPATVGADIIELLQDLADQGVVVAS